jgi:hypothetical protein
LIAVGTCTLVFSQAGDASYAPAPSVTVGFSVTNGTTGGGGSGAVSNDAPLPPWAYAILALLMTAGAMRRRAHAG